MVTEQPLTCPSITEAQRGGGEKGLEVLWSTRATQDHLLLSTSKDKAQKSRCVPQGQSLGLPHGARCWPWGSTSGSPRDIISVSPRGGTSGELGEHQERGTKPGGTRCPTAAVPRAG